MALLHSSITGSRQPTGQLHSPVPRHDDPDAQPHTVEHGAPLQPRRARTGSHDASHTWVGISPVVSAVSFAVSGAVSSPSRTVVTSSVSAVSDASVVASATEAWNFGSDVHAASATSASASRRRLTAPPR